MDSWLNSRVVNKMSGPMLDLSKEYNINIATVNKAINVLVDEGLVYKKRGIGMFVKKAPLRL